jgi:aryl-alcohol dehydrogenase-like predicted oxidoreductase
LHIAFFAANDEEGTVERRQFGKTDMHVSVLGFGGAEIGFEEASPETVARLLGDALDAGLNVIDTAECYKSSEELIGGAVASRRYEFYLFTKCGHPETSSVADWRPESLLKTIERSLKRLRTDRVDLVHLHSCSVADLKKGDVIAALQRAREKGYTRYIGYSGDSQAAKYAVECGAFDSLQTSVNLFDQEAIDLVLPAAREKQVGVIAKRPIGNAVWRYPTRPEITYHQTYWDRSQKLKYDFTQGDPKQATAMALRFTLSVPGVCTAIVGTKHPGRWRENAALLEAGPLPKEQLDGIRARWHERAATDWVGQI